MRAALAVALALAVAGCGTQAASSSAVTVSGKRLVVYLSDPQNVRSVPALQDVVYGAELAFTQKSAQVTRYTVSLHVANGRLPSDNARAAISDNQAIAYIGEIKPGDSVQTAGITEALDLLELSPTDAATISSGDYELATTYGATFAHLGPKPASIAGFASQFTADFHHHPSAQAAYGYQAMSVLLGALRSLGPQADVRRSVVKAVRALTAG